jgi:outer membrane murein-binding lipoprotein Lpp
MTKASPLFLVVLLLGSLSLYGCTGQKTGAINTKIREMEARYTKLEEDYRTIAAANDAFRKKLSQSEAQRAELAKEVAELRAVVAERDDLRKQVAARTGERDAAQAQLNQFNKDLQALAGRVQAALNNPPGTEVVIIPASRKVE